MWIRKKKMEEIERLLKAISTNLMLLNAVIQNMKTRHDLMDYQECGYSNFKNKFIMN